MKKRLNDKAKRLDELDSAVEDLAADPFLKELQDIWNSHSRSIDDILNTTDARPMTLNWRYAHSQRGRDMRVWLALALFNLAVAVASAALLWRGDWLLRASALVLTVADAAMAFFSFRRYLRLRAVVTRTAIVRRTGHTLSLPQLSTVSAAAALALLFVTTLPLGDGYTMTQTDRTLRAEAYTNAETILLQS